MVLAAANQSVAIRSIDIDPVNDELLADLFRSLQIGDNVCLQSGNSADFVPDYRYDLLFIDGDHRYDGVMKDLMSWWDNLVVGGSVIMHDSHHVDVADAIRDFTADQSVEFVLTAAGLDHALLEHGSLCHFRKL